MTDPILPALQLKGGEDRRLRAGHVAGPSAAFEHHLAAAAEGKRRTDPDEAREKTLHACS